MKITIAAWRSDTLEGTGYVSGQILTGTEATAVRVAGEIFRKGKDVLLRHSNEGHARPSMLPAQAPERGKRHEMMSESQDVFIVELAPGAYYLQGYPDRTKICSTGLAHRATPVSPGSLAYTLEMFPREAFPHVRLVALRITAEEISAQS